MVAAFASPVTVIAGFLLALQIVFQLFLSAVCPLIGLG